MWFRLLAGVSILVLSYASSALAEPFRLGPVYTDRPGEVSVVVEFESPPGDLPPSYFRLVEGGKALATAREIKSFKESGQGLALIICVDVSGSMKGDPLADTRDALLSFLGKVRPQDHIALVSFADDYKIESPFVDGDKQKQLIAAVRNLKQPRGTQTRLYQTLYDVLDMFKGAKGPKRRRLLIISDGKDEGSIDESNNVVDKAKSLFTSIDAVGRGRSETGYGYAKALQNLAVATGGKFAHARPDRLTLTDAVDWIYSNLSETHSLVVYFSYEKDAAERKIQDALIELQRPGDEHPSSERLLGEIPWSLEKPPPPPSLAWLSWLLFAVLLAISLAVVIRRRQKVEEVVGPRPTTPASPPASTPSLGLGPSVQEAPVILPEPGRPSGRPRDATVVGRYIFLMPEPGKPTAILRAVSGPLEGKQFSVEKESFDIGVSSENDLCIAQDNYVSEKHASLRYEKGSLRIYDKSSKNGTFVNQNKVPESGAALSLNDRIRVGMSTFEVMGAPR